MESSDVCDSIIFGHKTDPEKTQIATVDSLGFTKLNHKRLADISVILVDVFAYGQNVLMKLDVVSYGIVTKLRQTISTPPQSKIQSNQNQFDFTALLHEMKEPVNSTSAGRRNDPKDPLFTEHPSSIDLTVYHTNVPSVVPKQILNKDSVQICKENSTMKVARRGLRLFQS
jgi:hypothetical protein